MVFLVFSKVMVSEQLFMKKVFAGSFKYVGGKSDFSESISSSWFVKIEKYLIMLIVLSNSP